MLTRRALLKSASLNLAACSLVPRLVAADGQKDVRTDRHGDPLPAGAVTRLGSRRLVHRGGTGSLAFSPDGSLLASGGMDDAVRIWNVKTGAEVRRLQHELPSINRRWLQVTWSGDGTRIATSPCGDRSSLRRRRQGPAIRIWDAGNGDLRTEIPLPREIGPVCLALTEGGDTVVTAGYSRDGREYSEDLIRLHDAESGKLLSTIRDLQAGVFSVAISHHGDRIATGSVYWAGDRWKIRNTGGFRTPLSATVCVWDLDSGKKVLRDLSTDLKRSDVLSTGIDTRLSGATVFWSDDDRSVFLGTHDGQLTTLNSDTLKTVARLPLPTSHHSRRVFSFGIAAAKKGWFAAFVNSSGLSWQERQHPAARPLPTFGGASAIALSPNGKSIALATGGGRIEIRDAKAFRETIRIDRHAGAVKSVLWSDDAGRVVSLDVTGNLYVWDTEGRLKTQSWCDALLGFRRGSDDILCARRDGVVAVSAKTGQTTPLFQAPKSWSGINGTLSRDGETVAVWPNSPGRRDHRVIVLHLPTEKISEVLVPGAPGQVALSADGKRMAVRPAEETAVLVYEGHRLVRTCTIPHPPVVEGREWEEEGTRRGQLQFSPQGHVIASRANIAIHFWETKTGRYLHYVHSVLGDGFAFSPDGRKLAAHTNGGVGLINVADGSLSVEMPGHTRSARAFSFAPDGQRLATGSSDGTVLIWDVPGRNVAE